MAIYNRTRARAEALAAEFGVPAVYDDAEALVRRERPDFLDIVTDPATHARFVRLAAERRVPVVCQKPMATSLAEAEGMVRACREAGIPFLVHENWHWQRPLREAKKDLESGRLGRPFRGRIQFSSSFPVFDNQPALKDLDPFILADIGSHLLDTARFLFGEARRLFAVARRVRPDIRGEDVATVLLETEAGAAVTCEMSYASRLEHERFPQTYLLVEAEAGSLALGPDYEIRLTTREGTAARRCPPPPFPWADPAYDLVHASIVPCCADLGRHLRGDSEYRLVPVEVGPAGIENLRRRGLSPAPAGAALREADAVVLAVPDNRIGAISADVVPRMRGGAMLVCLDAAAPHAGKLPARPDVTYFVTHPCHPSAFTHESDPEAARDFLLGHLRIELAIVFEEIPVPFSDGARKAIERAKAALFRPDWKKVFEPEAVRESVEMITRPPVS